MKLSTNRWTPTSCLVRLFVALCCWGVFLGSNLVSPARAQESASLKLTKSANVSLATPGSLIYFKLTVQNEGVDPATSVVLTDPIPAGCTFVSATANGLLSNGLCSWNLGSLAPGASAEVLLYVRIRLGIPPTTLTNTAQVTCPQLSAPVNSNTVTVGLSLSLLPSLVITKSVDVAAAAQGSLVTFTMTVTNYGLGVATNVVLTDPVPAGCTPVFLSTGGTISNGVCAWNLGHLPVGASIQAQLQVKINTGVTGTIKNTARAICGQQGTPAESNTCLVTLKLPRLILTKSVSVTTAWVGKPLTYTITVKNSGDSPAGSVVITDPIPAGCVPVSISTGGAISGGICSWKVGSLAVGASVRVSLQVRIDAAITGTIKNTAQVGCDELPSPCPSNTVGCSVIPPPPPTLVLAKGASVSLSIPGSLVTYRLTLKNTGGQTATNVTLTDRLAAGLTFISASNGGTCSSGICAWNLGSLAPDATVQVTLQVKIGLGITGIITNTAKASCTQVPTLVLSNTVTLKVEALQLSLSKSANLAVTTPGSLVTFTLTVRNHGPGLATNVVVTDPVPVGCSFLSTSPGASISNGICTWSMGSLAAGASAQVRLQVQINLGVTGTITNQAKAICSETAQAVLSSRVSVGIVPPSLALSKVVNVAKALPGSLLTYTITLKNTGPGMATNVSITDPLPAGLTPVAVSAGGVVSGSSCSWNVGNLPAGAAVQVTVQARVNPGLLGTVTNVAKARCAELVNGVTSNGATVNLSLL